MIPLQRWPEQVWGPWPQVQVPDFDDVVAPPAEGDLPPVPVVAHAVEVIAPAFTLIERTLAAPDTAYLPLPLIVTAQPLPQQPATVLIGRSPVEAATPPEPLVVAAQPLPQQPALIFVQPPAAVTATPPTPLIVAGQPLPLQQPTVVVARGPVAAPAAPDQTPPKPAIVAGQPLPLPQPAVLVTQTRVDAPAGVDLPPVPVVAHAVEIIRPTFTLIPRRHQYGVIDSLPAVPTIAVGGSLTSAGQVFIQWSSAEPPTPAPQLPPKPLIVRAQPLPAEVQAPFRHQARVAPTPPIPPRPLIVAAQPRPADTQAPYRHQARADFTAAPDTTGPQRPLVVGAQQAPIEVSPTYRHQARVADPPATAVKPLVIGAVQSMPASGAAWVSRTTPLEPYRPATVVAGGPERPPEKAAIIIHRPWGPPPPSLNRPPIQVITYTGLPQPHGRSQIRKGFAEAFAAHLLPVTARAGADRYTAEAGTGQVTARPGVDRYRVGSG